MTVTLADQRKKIQTQLEALKIFSNTPTVRKLRKELQDRLTRIDARLDAASKRNLKKSKAESEEIKIQRRKEANAERSRWMKGVHRYVRLIHGNVHGTPNEFSYGEIMKMFFERRRGRKVSLSDVIWQNASI